MTKLQFRVLYREFLFRMVDLELLSAHALGDSNKLLGPFASLLIFLSMLLSIPAMGFGRGAPLAQVFARFSAEHFLISTTMLVVGLFAVLSWDSTFPDRRDVLVLAPLPVRPRTFFLANVAAVSAALGMTTVALHALSGLVWPLALGRTTPALTAPALTWDPAVPPAGAAGLQAMMDRDLTHPLEHRRHGAGDGRGPGDWRQQVRSAARSCVRNRQTGLDLRTRLRFEELHRPDAGPDDRAGEGEARAAGARTIAA